MKCWDSMKDNVNKIIKNGFCCGCENCYNICEFSAIKIVYDSEGFKYPRIDKNACVNCGKCLNVCPIENKNKFNIESHYIKAYGGYIKNDKRLLNSTSGGIATAITEFIINKSGIVYGVAYSNDFLKTEVIRVDSKNEIKRLSGSKYIESEKNGVFNKVKEDLENGKQVCYIGLPCDIAALKTYINRTYNKLITIELICMGPTSNIIFREYLENIREKFEKEIKSINLRSKIKNWKESMIEIILDNDYKFYEKFDYSDFAIGFKIMGRKSCYNCKFKGTEGVADITIGDLWGINEKNQKFNNKGMSEIFVNTELGINLIENIRNIELFDISNELEFYIKNNPRIFSSRKLLKERKLFSENFKRDGLKKACQNYKNVSFYIKKLIKEILKKINII